MHTVRIVSLQVYASLARRTDKFLVNTGTERGLLGLGQEADLDAGADKHREFGISSTPRHRMSPFPNTLQYVTKGVQKSL
jgi:hypothetical protein